MLQLEIRESVSNLIPYKQVSTWAVAELAPPLTIAFGFHLHLHDELDTSIRESIHFSPRLSNIIDDSGIVFIDINKSWYHTSIDIDKYVYFQHP